MALDNDGSSLEFTYLNDDRSVCIAVTQAGKGELPAKHGRIAIHYVLYTALDGENGSASTSFEEARLIDKSRSRGKPFHVTLGQEVTIPGLELALQQLREGDEALVSVASKEAFGAGGNPHGFHSFGGAIPASTSLLFKLSVLDVDNDYPLMEKWSTAEVLAKADKVKSVGNSYYKEQDLERALLKYRRAANIVNALKGTENSGEGERKRSVLIACYNNMSACWLGQSEAMKAIECAKQALEVDPKNVKAMFRKAKAHTVRQEYDESIKLLEHSIALDADNDGLKKEIERIKKLQRTADKKAKNFYGGMFSKIADPNSEEELYKREEIRQRQTDEIQSRMKKCNICGKEVEDIQYARHVIKFHGSK